MPNERNIATVAELTDKMERVQFVVVADYRGMNVAEMSDLRSQLRQNGAELVVAKNTLLRLAARATGKEAIESLLEGPTAITFVYDDITKAAKALNDYVRSSSKITVRGGLLGKSLLAADGLEQVTKMPSREQILAEVVGSIQSPVSSLVGLLNAPVSDVVGLVNAVTTNMVYALQARIDQLQSAGETASAA